MSLIVFLVVLLLLFGGGGFGWHAGWYGNGSPYGYGLFGGIGGILILVLLALLITGRL